MSDDILAGVDEGVLLPPAPTTFSGAPLTWAEIGALIQELPPSIRDRPALVRVDERVPHVTSYTLVAVWPSGDADAAVLPI